MGKSTAYIYRNPRDEPGNYCPHRKRNQKTNAFETSKVQENSEVSEAYKVGAYSHEDKLVLMSETVTAAVLDSVYGKTVAGCEWKEMYLISLSASGKKS